MEQVLSTTCFDNIVNMDVDSKKFNEVFLEFSGGYTDKCSDHESKRKKDHEYK